MIQWDHWHIEPSSICALQCPRCPRAEVSDGLLNRQLSLSFFKNQIGIDVAKRIKKVTFCGNDGDPIYCRDLIDICVWFKTLDPTMQIVIVTNGSFKPAHWWESLAKTLNQFDEVHWSLDGWDQKSNEQYRVKSDWDSIIQGIKTFRKTNTSSYLVWDAIAFSFNQNNLDAMRLQAKSLGFDGFQLTKSTKFGSKYPSAYGTNDLLEPSNPELVSSSHRFERTLTSLTAKPKPGAALKIEFIRRAANLGKYSGICLIGNKGVFLNSRGEFYPCCWTANRYPHNLFWHNKFNLNTKTFTEIINDPFWTSEFLNFNHLECQTKCTSEQLSNLAHISEW